MGSSSWSWRRVAGLAGIVFFVLFVVLIALSFNGPVFDDPADEVREFFVDDDALVHVVTWLGALAFVFFFLPFAAGLRNLLAPADEADQQMWSRLSYTGAVLVVAVGGLGSAFWEVLSQGTAEDLSDARPRVVALDGMPTRSVYLKSHNWNSRFRIRSFRVAKSLLGSLAF